jgi:hypothetical protein
MILQDITAILDIAILILSPITAVYSFLLLRYEYKNLPERRHSFPLLSLFISLAAFFGVLANSLGIDLYLFIKNVFVVFILVASLILLREKIRLEIDPEGRMKTNPTKRLKSRKR